MRLLPSLPVSVVSLYCLWPVIDKYYMHFQFLDSTCPLPSLVNRFPFSFPSCINPPFFCLLVFLLSRPTSSFSINTETIKACTMAKPWGLLLGGKDKGNEDLGWFWVPGTQNYYSYCPSLCWVEVLDDTWWFGHGIPGNILFSTFLSIQFL